MATQSSPIEYSDIDAAMQTLDAEMEPSEVHGAICGFLCATPSVDANSLANTLFREHDKNNLLQRDAVAMVSALVGQSLQQLNDPTCDFHLLLPEESSHDVIEQVQALSEWCRGFLFGISAAGVNDLNQLPEEAVEVANDFVEISRASSVYEIQGDEDDEESFQELMEYVRVGALLINELMHPSQKPPEMPPTLH
jgi:uncharacterized protein YgfB (UPF0149 family)